MTTRTPLRGFPASENIPRTMSTSHDPDLRLKKYKLQIADERQKREQVEAVLEIAQRDRGRWTFAFLGAGADCKRNYKRLSRGFAGTGV
jgi:hypothetical protein